MRIGINGLLLTPKRAGTGWYSYYLLQSLLRLDQKNKYTLFLPGRFSDQEIKERDNVIVHKLPDYTNNTWNRIFWEQAILPGLIEKYGLTVFHSPSFSLPVYKKLPLGTKYIITVHDLAWKLFPETFGPWRRCYTAAVFPRAIARADKMIAVSNNTKQDLISSLATPAHKISLIYNGHEPFYRKLSPQEIDHTLLKKHNITANFILTVGTLEPRKNIIGLIKAYGKLPENLKNTYQLVIAGGRGWKYKDIFREINKLSSASRIIFTGYLPREELRQLYNQASLFVYPSIYEGFGFPVLEALACGVPVITANTSSLPEVAGEAAVFIDPRSAEDISSAISMLLTEKEVRETLIRKGPAQVKKFSWERAAEETLNIYHEVAHS